MTANTPVCVLDQGCKNRPHCPTQCDAHHKRQLRAHIHATLKEHTK